MYVTYFIWSAVVLILFVVWVKFTNQICSSMKRLDGKTVIITGGSSGIGLEIAKDLARRGARVIVACRFEGIKAEKLKIETSENNNVVFKKLNLASLLSTRNFAENILQTEDRLDILINNAGHWVPYKINPDGMDFTMQVNYYGHFLLTILLLPILKKSGKPEDPARVINTSSILHWLGRSKVDEYNNRSWILANYCDSKLSLAMFSRELAKIIASANVVVNTADPGLVGTEIYDRALGNFLGGLTRMLFYYFSKNPWQGSQTSLHVALDTQAGKVSGKFFVNCKIAATKNLIYDDKITGELFKHSIKLVKLSDEELKYCLYE